MLKGLIIMKSLDTIYSLWPCMLFHKLPSSHDLPDFPSVFLLSSDPSIQDPIKSSGGFWNAYLLLRFYHLVLGVSDNTDFQWYKSCGWPVYSSKSHAAFLALCETSPQMTLIWSHVGDCVTTVWYSLPSDMLVSVLKPSRRLHLLGIYLHL